MNAVGLKKIKRLSVMLTVILVLVCFMPVTAFAAPGDMTIEYRYAEGESVDVPATITRLNREYRLVNQAAPVLETTLPVTRTYTYRIDGALSEADLAQIAAIPGLSLEANQEELQREVEKVVTVENLSSNDVDELANKAPETMPCENGTGTLQRSGVVFTVAGTDSRGLPSGYNATIVYRGLETYMGDVYYVAEDTYQSTVQESTMNQYVIIATYEPVNATEETTTTAAAESTQAAESEQGVTTPAGPEESSPVEVTDEDVPLAPGAESEEAIADEDVPLAAPAGSSFNNALPWIIIGFAVVLIGGLFILFLVRKRKKEDANR